MSFYCCKLKSPVGIKKKEEEEEEEEEEKATGCLDIWTMESTAADMQIKYSDWQLTSRVKTSTNKSIYSIFID